MLSMIYHKIIETSMNVASSKKYPITYTKTCRDLFTDSILATLQASMSDKPSELRLYNIVVE